YPRIDHACTRDFGLIVTDGRSFFSEEKRHANSVHEPVAVGVPAFRVASRCADGRYHIDKLVLADPRRDVVLQRIALRALRGTLADYRLYALLAPHLVNRGAGNTAWIGEQRNADAVRRRPRDCARGRLLRAVSRAQRRLRRFLGRLAGPQTAFRAALALRRRARR